MEQVLGSLLFISDKHTHLSTLCNLKYTVYIMSILEMGLISESHKYTLAIPEPAPSLSRHGAQIGGLQVFPVIKTIVVHHLRMLVACTAVCVGRQSHVKSRTVREDCEHICFAFVFVCVVGKNSKSPKSEPHGWQGHYTGLYRSGISCVYL